MDTATQKLIALEAIHQWGQAVLSLVERLNEHQADVDGLVRWKIREFRSNRHFLLIAAGKLLDNINWAKDVGGNDCEYISDVDLVFLEIEGIRDTIKVLRNKNEHVEQYMSGTTKSYKGWNTPGGGDASGTLFQSIGGRLDWNDLAAIIRRMLNRLPAFYDPPSSLFGVFRDGEDLS